MTRDVFDDAPHAAVEAELREHWGNVGREPREDGEHGEYVPRGQVCALWWDKHQRQREAAGLQPLPSAVTCQASGSCSRRCHERGLRRADSA